VDSGRGGDGGDGGDGGGDSAGDTAEVECQALTLERVQAFEAADLLAEGEDPEALPQVQGPGVALGDIDGDGWLDAVMSAGAHGSVGLRNDGAGLLVIDASITFDGGRLPHATSAALADLDADGDLDLVLTRTRGEPDLIGWNDGAGRFTGEPLPDSLGEGLSPAIADFDGDGDLDVLVGGFVPTIDHQALEAGEVDGDGVRLYLQDAGHLRAAPEGALPESVLTSLVYHAAPLDWEGDGDIDLYLANDYGQYVVDSTLLVNDGSGRFTDGGRDCLCTLSSTVMGAAVGDADGDGRPDIFATDWGRNHLFLQQSDGAYVDFGETRGGNAEHADSVVSWGASFVDLDGDGDPDLPIAYGAPIAGPAAPELEPDAVLINDGAGSFTDRSLELGFTDDGLGRSVAVGDLDRDGRPDLVVAGRLFLRAWRAGGGCPDRVTLRLDAGAGNPGGIGARVLARVGERSWTWWMLPSTSFSSSAQELYLGAGGAGAFDAIEVTWPGGAVSEVEGVAPGVLALSAP